MKHKNLFSFLFYLVLNTTVFAQYTDVINSNRPGKSMSAFSVGKTVIQAEGGLFGIREKHDLARYEANGFGTELSLRYGAILEQLEFILETQYQYDWYIAPLVDDTRGGFKQVTLGAKYLLYDPFKNVKETKPNLYSWKANHSSKFNWRDLVPAVGVYAGFNLNMGTNPYTFPSDPFISPKVMIITQHHFGPKWVWVNNFIADKYLTDFPSLGIVSTLTRGFNMRWSGFLEAQGYQSDFYSDTVLRVGGAYLIRENIQIDASINKNIKETPSLLIGNIGLSWRFDSNYEDILNRVGKPNKGKKGKGKNDKKKKSKKRKDEVELEKTKP
jgi:hypothetical protein